MRLRDARIWAVVLAAAFAVLWCISIGAGYSAPAAEPLAEVTAVAGEPLPTVGLWGWALVGVGALVVVAGVILCNLPHRRRKYTRAGWRSRKKKKWYR